MALDTSKFQIKKYIDNQSSLDTLSFITCGSVDDGKSTLIGSMLYESKQIFDDHNVSNVHSMSRIVVSCLFL